VAEGSLIQSVCDAFAGQLSGDFQGGEQTAGECFSLPRNIAGRTMIDARSHDRQSQCGVDGGFEGERFDGDMSLIVIHADESVGSFSLRGKKGCV